MWKKYKLDFQKRHLHSIQLSSHREFLIFTILIHNHPEERSTEHTKASSFPLTRTLATAALSGDCTSLALISSSNLSWLYSAMRALVVSRPSCDMAAHEGRENREKSVSYKLATCTAAQQWTLSGDKNSLQHNSSIRTEHTERWICQWTCWTWSAELVQVRSRYEKI